MPVPWCQLAATMMPPKAPPAIWLNRRVLYAQNVGFLHPPEPELVPLPRFVYPHKIRMMLNFVSTASWEAACWDGVDSTIQASNRASVEADNWDKPVVIHF